jgi:hypothetical protein
MLYFCIVHAGCKPYLRMGKQWHSAATQHTESSVGGSAVRAHGVSSSNSLGTALDVFQQL